MSDPIPLLAHARQALRHSPVEIESAANPRLRHLRELLESGRERRRSGQTVLEGWHLLESWLAGGRPVLQLVLPRRTFQQLGQGGEPPSQASRREHGRSPSANPWQRVSPQRHPAPGISSGEAASMNGNPEMATLAAQASWLVLDDRLFDQLDIMPSPSPMLAVVETPRLAPPASAPDHDLVILDRIQDPGNVGTILRTAAAAGIRTVLTTAGTAACWAPKVLRAGMGGHFVLDIHENIPLEQLKAQVGALPLAGTVLQDGQSLYATDLRQPLAWVFGNEGEGIDPELQARLGCRLTIPQDPGVESLNVAASVAVCLFEQRRQRLASAS